MRPSSEWSSLAGGAAAFASSFFSFDRLEGAADRMGAGEAGPSSFSGVVCAPPPPLASYGWILMADPTSPRSRVSLEAARVPAVGHCTLCIECTSHGIVQRMLCTHTHVPAPL
jgi:hypothetical protein